jgi:hypothetical protein
MAAVFLPVDRLALERGARLVDALEAGQDAKLVAELRHLEDRFGLSPLARQRLQWQIETLSARSDTPRRPRRDTRLHAVS